MIDLITIEGSVAEIIFQNSVNGYTVCEVQAGDEFFTAVGYMPGVVQGEGVRLTGSWTTHLNYGRQLKVSLCERTLPQSTGAILMYLSSGVIPGVREATARRIIERFGEDSLNVIRDRPEELSKIRGISLNRAKQIHNAFLEKQSLQEIVMFLQKYGISPDIAARVYQAFGVFAVEEIRRNPYVLCERIRGISFKTADRIALDIGFSQSHPERVRAALEHILTTAAGKGHTFLPPEKLLEAAASFEIGPDDARNQLVYMLNYGYLSKFEDSVYLPALLNAEREVAAILYTLMRAKRARIPVSEADIISDEGIKLSDEQVEACRLAAEEGVVVITGGPGTGKTTIIRTIIKLMSAAGLRVALTAPTGRAAKRMSETCGVEAKTLHRLLEIEFTGDDDMQRFGRDEARPLDFDVFIVDEMSMVDISIMHGFLKAVPPNARLIMVGDVDQLPSVGPGCVLRDIIESGAIKVIKLSKIYRQAAKSLIVLNAHRINAGDKPILNKTGGDFFLIRTQNVKRGIREIIETCAERLPRAYGYDSVFQIQVLTPVRKGEFGVRNLNRHLQSVLNPPSDEKNEHKYGENVFREQDKVMQIKNNYNITWQRENGETGQGVFNGDIGIIKKIDSAARTLTVVFDDDRIVDYDFDMLDELELAFAITVHKSQGCEFPVIVMPMFSCAPMLMTRNLLYTAVTRAEELVVLIGEESVLLKMVKNNHQARRYSNLCHFLSAAAEGAKRGAL